MFLHEVYIKSKWNVNINIKRKEMNQIRAIFSEDRRY